MIDDPTTRGGFLFKATQYLELRKVEPSEGLLALGPTNGGREAEVSGGNLKSDQWRGLNIGIM